MEGDTAAAGSADNNQQDTDSDYVKVVKQDAAGATAGSSEQPTATITVTRADSDDAPSAAAATPAAAATSSSTASGSGSSSGKKLVVAKKGAKTGGNDDEWDDIEDEDIDETLWERFLALSEMFPSPVRTGAGKLVRGVCDGVAGAYSMSRQVAWLTFSTATILVIPVLFEMERTQMEQQQLQHQRQVLLGPNTAVSGNLGAGGMPPIAMMPPTGGGPATR